MGTGCHRLQRPPEVMVHLSEALEVAVEDIDIGVHPDGQGGGGHAGHPRSQDDDSGRPHPGHPAHQHPTTAPRAHQVMGSHQRSHPPGHLAHGREQRQRVVGRPHRLVGDGGVARRHQRLGAGPRGGQVQVGEEDLPLPQTRRGYSSAIGSFTPRTMSDSAQMSAATVTILAPVAMNSASGIDEPTPRCARRRRCDRLR